jgi:hypothetical protein
VYVRYVTASREGADEKVKEPDEFLHGSFTVLAARRM